MATKAQASPAASPLHPARLLVSAAVSAQDFSKKFEPSIENTPDLPVINWGAVGKTAPQLLASPSDLQKADAVIITWAAAEWAAMEHVFCSSDKSMPYGKRNSSSWSGWIKCEDGAPANLGYWGYYRLVRVGDSQVLLFKSNVHYAATQGEQNIEALTNLLLRQVKPAVILSIGTAGGTRLADHVGTVNIVHTDVLYESNQPQNVWPSYSNQWSPNSPLFGGSSLNALLFSVPTIATDLQAIATQFNSFYGTNFPLSELNPNNLNLGTAVPTINNLTAAGTPLVTAKSFVVGNTSGNLSNFACVEMDDAIIARTAKGKSKFGSIRNISDPIQNSALTEKFQGHWGEAIYTAYGLYTSYNGAIAAWAALN
jgi:nucleoside phosphorylase